jgi:uncharacterized protein YbjT (DUF2867 family)
MTPPVLIAGASGYVGGRLLSRLVEKGIRPRCLARQTEGLAARYGETVELRQANLMEPETLPPAMEGIHTAVYLVHSMGAAGDFEAREQSCAEHFAKAAREAGLHKIIYLGGLCDDHAELSPHMRSRHETGRILRDSGVPVLELRASIVLGAGSLSFEMIRALVQRLPVMITPKWVHVSAQPIFIADLIEILCQAIELPLERSRVVEIGGSEVTSYLGIMKTYANARGLKRFYLPVPVLSPYVSSLWLGLVTPLFARVGRRLIESVTHPSVIRNPVAETLFDLKPRNVEESVRAALAEEEAGFASTRWSDSLTSGQTHKTWAGVRFGTRLYDVRTREVAAPAEKVYNTFLRSGGSNGWHFATPLWKLRGILDELCGGVGMRRGRKHPQALHPGDVLDCWRVEQVEPGRSLRLRAEMKLPGRAWLEFEVLPLDKNRSRLQQTAVYDPLGLAGLLYWYAIYPLHEIVFRGMIRGIAKAAEH